MPRERSTSTSPRPLARARRRLLRTTCALLVGAALAQACVEPLGGLCVGQTCTSGLYIELRAGPQSMSPGTYAFRVALSDEDAGLTDVEHAWSCVVTTDPRSLQDCETAAEPEPGHVIEAFLAGDEPQRLWLRAYQGPDETRLWTGHDAVHVVITRDETVLHDKRHEPRYELVTDDECMTCKSRETSIDLAAADE